MARRSNRAVKRLPGSAQETRTCLTPCSGHDSAARRLREWSGTGRCPDAASAEAESHTPDRRRRIRGHCSTAPSRRPRRTTTDLPSTLKVKLDIDNNPGLGKVENLGVQVAVAHSRYPPKVPVRIPPPCPSPTEFLEEPIFLPHFWLACQFFHWFFRTGKECTKLALRIFRYRFVQ